ncbi:uncharacterized membrane protein YoaK (UPF0700 family) [Scopulibacillus daqui]|uniref:Uncharacterized membrane protein YoaK (UPF0700 family) n=1 Tax=Scopulibacillus daqui TaxID=1469162 RepID=A0ABS2Q1D9_9BACL|nr:YoaK family protein [Scopulibacillus daqui]MBM7646100.1 uncharacterized membrane protein YoaK (UPF0700 family) [Scopulibacillus daqui]
MEKESFNKPAVTHREIRQPYYYKLLFVYLLSAAGGCVDAMSYLGLGEVFTANMTGNTVLLGVKWVDGDINSLFLSALSLVGFFIGVAIGFTMTESVQGDLFRSQRLINTIVMEAALLSVLAVFIHLTNGMPGKGWIRLLVFIASAAMGIQSTITRRINLRGVATTFITGMMVSVVETITKNTLDSCRRQLTSDKSAGASSNWGFQLFSWLIYLLGGVIGGWFTLHYPKYFGWPAVAIIGMAIMVMIVFRLDKRMIDKPRQNQGSRPNVSG